MFLPLFLARLFIYSFAFALSLHATLYTSLCASFLQLGFGLPWSSPHHAPLTAAVVCKRSLTWFRFRPHQNRH
ncbi:hypothetical protein F5Y13DRAFT_167634 [Hypoxylon sp. FL1857]|nr:hypothetical protein F5Y13DRAFT_167634 [Hypoxylon sp. FL1857]